MWTDFPEALGNPVPKLKGGGPPERLDPAVAVREREREREGG